MYDVDIDIHDGLYVPTLEIENNIPSDSETRIYELEYDFEDEISKYQERAYFEFPLNNNRYNLEFSSNVRIHFPESVQNVDDINVWIRRQEYIEEDSSSSWSPDYIKYKDNDTVFLNNIDAEKLEFSFKGGTSNCLVKILLPATLFNNEVKEMYVSTISEINEIEEAIPSLQKFLKGKKIKTIITPIIVAVIIYSIFLYIPVRIIFKKYGKIYEELERSRKRKKYKYYRDIDMKNMTPIKAWALTNNEFIQIPSKDFENILTSTILYLKLKGYFKITKISGETILMLTDEDKYKLGATERRVLKYVEDIMEKESGSCARKELKIKVSKIQEYMTKEKNEIIELYGNLENKLLDSLSSLTKNKSYCSKYKELYNHYNNKFKEFGGWQYLMHLWAMVVNIVILCISDILGVLAIIFTILIFKKYIKGDLRKKEILNEEGIEEAEKYHGLKRYLKDYSIIKDREILEVELWEEYLMYATVFGIAKKTIKQMDLDYPDYESFFALRY